jgi:nucleotide sugar dehydrogenase
MKPHDDRRRPVVCVQGLGFVGAAMAVAVAEAKRPDGAPCFDVIGVDLKTPEGQRRIAEVNAGRFPFATADPALKTAAAAARQRGNLKATFDPSAYESAAIAIVDVHLDVTTGPGLPTADLTGFRAAIRTLGQRLPEGALVIIETTVPPGTTARVVAPDLEAALAPRGLPASALLLAHSYERVMPGPDYLHSIINFWRVYAGHTEAAGEACRDFLSQVIDVERFPLSRLKSTTASETAKVLENSYRAVNIAFIEEWSLFAEAVGIDLFEILDAIRMRPTHNNIRQPGLGVGGYCLTKDPYFGSIAARELFDRPQLAFPFSTQAMAVNAATPILAVDRVERLLGGSLPGKRVLLLGVAYRSDVVDTRYSPSETFVREVSRRGGTVVCHDPFVTRWEEMSMSLPVELPSPVGFDAIVFAVSHAQYRALDVPAWIGAARCAVLDANRVLSPETLHALRGRGIPVAMTGVGD